jgi:UDP-3-O-[3-hydroxymyristoyl] N-acetylglucosamine deacetylase
LQEPEIFEKTFQKAVSVSGVGLFTGEKVSLTFLPADTGSGIVFQRVDLPGAPEIPAVLSSVREWPRCTKLETEGASVQMVEHLLSALSAYGIDNLRIEMKGPEIPAGDGSALLFVRAIEEAGVLTQLAKRQYIKIQDPIYWSEGDVHLIGLPADAFCISYTLHYPQSKIIGSQFYSFICNAERYKQEIAPCRTFSLYEEIAPFIEKGFLKGGGLENALVVKNDLILNPEGARFPNEMVRHKVLDLIGDLALTGFPILGHIIAVRSGHSSNLAFARKLASASQAREEYFETFANSYVLENR